MSLPLYMYKYLLYTKISLYFVMFVEKSIVRVDVIVLCVTCVLLLFR